MENGGTSSALVRLRRAVDGARDHVRGGAVEDAIVVVEYGDFLCPYCRRLRQVMGGLREAIGDRLVYVFRHFPNERAHPGAESVARAAEAAAAQGRFWEMHDWIYDREPPISDASILDFARSLGLDMDRFARDIASDQTRARVEQDLTEGRRNGVTVTPTLFVDGILYDGAWDFDSMLEGLERPVAARVKRSARVFASLPASGGLVLLLAAAAALLCANTPIAPFYQSIVRAPLSIGPPGLFSMSVAEWCSEGLLSFFFLLVGLEIRRAMTAGPLSDRRAAALPIAGAVGGVIVPALIYLAINRGPTRAGWSVPTATDVAFTIGILAVLGDRIPSSLRVFVAALAVADDLLSVGTLAVSRPGSISLAALAASALITALLIVLNRSRVYAAWPYAFVTMLLWASLHAAGVHAALAGIVLAAALPTRPAAAAGPLLAQAATALAALEHAEKEAARARAGDALADLGSIWDWTSRTLTAASDRLLSPADRIERAVAPWSAYLVLPLFAFSATGVRLAIDSSRPGTGQILAGIVLGLVVGKPLGILVASWLAVTMRIAVAPAGVAIGAFIGAALLCGVSDTVALLIADQALPPASAATAKLGVLIGSTIAAALGTGVLVVTTRRSGSTAGA